MKLIFKLIGGLLLIGVVLVFIMEADPFGAAEERNAQQEAEQAVEDTVTKNSIRLVDGEFGEYGQKVTIPSETFEEYTYIWYNIPSGTYTAIYEGEQERATVFIVGNESSEDVRDTLYFNQYGESQQITIEDGTHLELSIGADLLLNPIEE